MNFNLKKKKDDNMVEIDSQENEEFKSDLEALGFDFASDGVINLNDNVEADIVMEQKQSKIKTILKFLLIFVALISLIIILCYIFTSKIVLHKVVGASNIIGNMSIITNSYQCNKSDIIVGTDVVYLDNDSIFCGPLLVNEGVGTITAINNDGLVLTIQPAYEEGEEVPVVENIATSKVLYIIEEDYEQSSTSEN